MLRKASLIKEDYLIQTVNGADVEKPLLQRIESKHGTQASGESKGDKNNKFT